MVLTILFSFLISFGLRWLGVLHPEPFEASTSSLVFLLAGPVLFAAISVVLIGLGKTKQI